ncbi:hypothetical protein G9A89_010273 [Geosiphon pyriformis]|nr:hypothetical protein G9A89_010273 [Geosiphon pyriformis]
MKQDTTQATPFELIYGRTAILSVEIEIITYLIESITEENFQETLATDNIQKSQEKQKKRHDNQLPDKPVEFRIGDKDKPFHIEEILGNGAYKLRLDNKILTKAAHRDRLKSYHNITPPSTNTRKTSPHRTQKKTENTVNKIIAKVKLAIKESTKELLYQELTKETWNWWIQQFPRNYCYFYLGQHAQAIYQIHTAFQDQPEILLNKAMDTVTSNQLEKITNAQFEELQTQITQVILENEIQKILQKRELTKLDFNGAQY